MECQENLNKIKKDFKKIGKKYKLPKFEELAREFDIEKIAEKETSFLLRDVRRAINEKISAYLHLFETLINPSSPPLFIFSILKNLEEKEQKIMKEIYSKLVKFQLKVLGLDTIYNEKEEAQFIKNVYHEWQKLKIQIHSLFEGFDKKFRENNTSVKKGYLG